MALFSLFPIFFHDKERFVALATHALDYDEEQQLKEIFQWLADNNIEYTQKPHICNLERVIFSKDEDYIGFKLRWS